MDQPMALFCVIADFNHSRVAQREMTNLLYNLGVTVMDKHAIFIGCNRYDKLPNLNYAVNDVSELSKAFSDLLGFNPDRIAVLSDGSEKKPLRNKIYSTLAELNEKLKPEDLLIFYFVGLGAVSENGKDCLLASDTVQEALESTAVKVEDVVQFLKKTGCNNIVMFLDCHITDEGARRPVETSIGYDTHRALAEREAIEGSQKGRGFTSGTDSQKAGPGSGGIAVFFSCSPRENSYEIDELQHSSFAYNLLEALKRSDCSTVKEMDEFLLQNVPKINNLYYKPPQKPFSVITPLEMGIRYYFANRQSLESLALKTDALLAKLGEIYIKGSLESGLFATTAEFVDSAREGFRDDRQKKIYELVDRFSNGKVNSSLLKGAFMAVQRGMDDRQRV
jgi:hypothetical protein